MSAARQAILNVVERCARDVDVYHRLSNNETQARREFIDPFFAALHRQLSDARTRRPRGRGPRSCSNGRRRRELCRTIDATDRQFDGLVCEFYGLKEEKIRAVASRALASAGVTI